MPHTKKHKKEEEKIRVRGKLVDAPEKKDTFVRAKRRPTSPKDPIREELRQKQLREDPAFAAEVAILEERQQAQIQAEAQEKLKTPEQEAIEEERARLTAEEPPVRRELSPDLVPAETIPVLGGIEGASRNLVLDLYKKAGIEFQDNEGKPLLLQPQQLRTATLTRIEQEEIDRGLTASERFGSFIEGIPIAGSLVAKYASGLIETPSSNAREALSNIRKERRRISNIVTNDIKLLFSETPQIKFNTDAGKTIEAEILLTKEKIFQGKQNILEGALINPDEIQLFLKLQSLGETEE